MPCTEWLLAETRRLSERTQKIDRRRSAVSGSGEMRCPPLPLSCMSLMVALTGPDICRSRSQLPNCMPEYSAASRGAALEPRVSIELTRTTGNALSTDRSAEQTTSARKYGSRGA